MVTFAFTDIEGGAVRWERNRAAMQNAMRRHDAIFREAIERRGGRVFKTIGSAFCTVFARAEDAVAAMLAAQRSLIAEDFSAVDGIRVRSAIHTGAAEEREGDYFGPAVNKVARLLAIGHGGQILLTAESAAIVASALGAGASLRELGEHHLKDFAEPQRLFQLVAPGLPAEFPPLRSLGALPSHLSVVDAAEFRSVPSFSGRDDELAALHTALQSENAVAVIHGLGGVGKSSIAREYGWRNREAYSIAWWLNAQTEEGIVDGLLRLGSMFVHGLDQLADRRAAAQRVINSVLGGFDKPALLVFDNLEDERLMRTWLPRTGARALATARDAALSGDVVAIPLQIWSLETAVAYLQRASGRPDMCEADARAIAEALGALPLAMAHAAAALRGMRMMSPQRYLERINAHLKNAPRGAEYPHSVFATFSTAIVQAEQQAPGAAAVLAFAASFAPNAIPEELFHPAIELVREGLTPVVPGYEPLDLHSTLAGDSRLHLAQATLDRLALLTFAQGSRTYAMHRLVQLAARTLIADPEAWAEVAVNAARAIFPPAEFSTWPQCERLLPHARAALDALERNAEPLEAADLARRCANYLFARGEYTESEGLCTRALAIVENVYGPSDPKITTGLNNLAVLYAELGRFSEAEPLHTRVLAIREKEWGPDVPLVAKTLYNLAIVYMELGRLDESEALQKRGLAIREKSATPSDPDLLTSLTGLGVLYRMQGRYTDSVPLLERVLAIREERLGPEHPDVATSLMYLADVYADSGRTAEAESLYRRALATWERALGPEHPDVAECLKGLGSMYRSQGRYDEAEPVLARALAIREKRLGPNHHYTKATREALDAVTELSREATN